MRIMYDNVFAILMVIALGLISGCVLGLIPGFILAKTGGNGSDMPPRDRRLNIVSIAVCTSAANAILAWYSLVR